MGARDGPFRLECQQVAADGRRRGADRIGDLLNRRIAVAEEVLANGREAIVFHAPGPSFLIA
ncbi:hypothetical protein D3C72_2270580 [compost metagenome]